MATRKFIKMYNIRHDDVDDKGNINPNAALYPLYMGQYIDNNTGKSFMELSPDQIDDKLSDVDREYDNSSNAHPNRTVQIHLLGDKDPFQTVGPNLKRGYSALAFTNKDKRHGDDYFSGWHKIDHDKDIHKVDYTPLDNIAEHRRYAERHKDADSDIMSMAHTIAPGERYKGFYTLPLIVEADDEDVINYNDVVKDSYDPTRDYLPEVQLKRIIKKSVMPNALTNNAKAVYLSRLVNVLRYLDKLLPKVVDYKDRLTTLDSVEHKDAQKVYDLLQRVFDESIEGCAIVASMCQYMLDNLKDMPDVTGSYANVTHISEVISRALQNMEEPLTYLKYVRDWLMQGPVDQDANMEAAKVTSDALGALVYPLKDIRGSCKGLYYGVLDLPDMLNANRYTPDTNIMQKATQKGGAFDWYDKSTYSDERLKDIYSDYHDITLSDKQLKYVYDDFMKFKKGATQSNITKGLRGLGQ